MMTLAFTSFAHSINKFLKGWVSMWTPNSLDIVIISIFYPPIIVATFRYAKLISGSVWRLIDSSMQIELMRRNIEVIKLEALETVLTVQN